MLLWPKGISERLADAHLHAVLAHELWHVRRRDNLVAALPTALVIFQLGSLWGERAMPWAGPAAATLLAAAGVNAAVALGTWRAGLVAGSGALAGALAGTVVIVSGGWGAYAVLWVFFLGGTAATRWGYRRKAAAGVAQPDRGRRGVSHVVANIGVPAALLVLGAPPIAFAAALAAALADTLGTEIGSLYGRRPFSLIPMRRLEVGAAGEGPKELPPRFLMMLADGFIDRLFKTTSDLVVDVASMTSIDPKVGGFPYVNAPAPVPVPTT